jgi:hypothetical protein
MLATHSPKATPEAKKRIIRSERRKNVLALAASQPEVKLSPAQTIGRGILHAILVAKITPRQTVENVCTKLIRADAYSRYKYECLLTECGLRLILDGVRPRLVLLSATLFEKAFPNLKFGVPLLDAYKGILVGTAGEPFAPIKLVVVNRHPKRSVALPTGRTAGVSGKDDELIREFILSYPLGGTTVRQLIESPNAAGGGWESTTAFVKSMLALTRYGIMLRYCGDDEVDLAADYYAQVVDSKLLSRRIPALRKLATDLTGLALY